MIANSELIINRDGSIYHLNLCPADIAHDIITVGDPDRVDVVASRLDEVFLTRHKREFKTVTGRIGSKSVTILSTGIGTDNIDIVLTELDALANIDFTSRTQKEEHTRLRFYRLGTSGTVKADIPIDSILLSAYGVGLDGLLHFYKRSPDARSVALERLVNEKLTLSLPQVRAYAVAGSKELLTQYSALGQQGITTTATGFYGPQGRTVRAQPLDRSFVDRLAGLSFEELHFTNLEMETAGIYGMAELLGHDAISFNAILANRSTGAFSTDPQKAVNGLIDRFFEAFVSA